jgi:hypothetical protein
VSPRISPHTTASRDSMIPSVTNGATIGSAASKKHEKLPRGLSATMIVLPRNHREQHRTSRSCLLMTARMAAIFREAFQKCMQGGRGRSPQTHLHSAAAAISPTEAASRAASWRDRTFSVLVCTWKNGQRGRGGNCHMYLANLLRVPVTHCV